jgi:hypothetical protein
VTSGDDVYILPNNYLTVQAGGSQSPSLQLVPGDQQDAAASDEPVVIEAAHEVRCASCDKLLAEKAAVPYRIACPRCKVIAEAA